MCSWLHSVTSFSVLNDTDCSGHWARWTLTSALPVCVLVQLREAVYAGQLKKEIINCLNIETVLPSMQQITLICPVLSPSRPAFITYWGFFLSRRHQRANIFMKAIKRSSAKAWNYFLIWRHFNEDWRRWLVWLMAAPLYQWVAGRN